MSTKSPSGAFRLWYTLWMLFLVYMSYNNLYLNPVFNQNGEITSSEGTIILLFFHIVISWILYATISEHENQDDQVYANALLSWRLNPLFWIYWIFSTISKIANKVLK